MPADDTSFVAEEGQTSFTMERVFDAPRELVFEAITKPEHLRKWWGPRSYELVTCEIDLRTGGSYRFVQRASDGGEHPFKGEYREVVPPERIVCTFVYDVEFIRDHGAIQTMTLEEEGGKTRLITITEFQSVEDRDAALGTGMKDGAVETWDRLAELLDALQT